MINENFEKELNQFGDTIRKIREYRGFTQEEVVELTGISRSTLVEIEKGRRSLLGLNGLRLCVVLEISPDMLVEMAFKNWKYPVKKVEWWGGEEVLALNSENLDFEVIPGVTSPISVLNYAGIPITQRGIAQSFHIVTGMTSASEKINWNALANENGTLFLGDLMLADNWEDFVYCITKAKDNWKLHYFTNRHYWIFALFIVKLPEYCSFVHIPLLLP